MKFLKSILALSLLCCLFVPLTTVSAASEQGVRARNARQATVSRNDPCNDGILYKNSVVMFDEYPYTVDNVDVKKNMVYNDKIGAWIPGFCLLKVDKNGNWIMDQTLTYNDYFKLISETTIHPTPDTTNPYFGNDGYLVRDIDTYYNTALVYFPDGHGKTIPTWIHSESVSEVCGTARY